MPDTSAIRWLVEQHHIALAERIVPFVEREIASLPVPGDDDAARVQARALLATLGRGGWLEPIASRDLRACCLVREALASASPLADHVFALQALGTTPILLAEHQDLERRWLPVVTDGTAMAAFAMTEPDAGSDVASLTTTAQRDGDSYVLDGIKTLISNAGIADFYTVFATTDPGRGRDGISCFVVPADTAGLVFTKAQIASAPHPLGEIAFDGCRVPATSRLGTEGEGYRLGLATLDRLRATVAAAACGMAARAMEEALVHVTSRHQFGKPLAHFQLTQARLAGMATDLDAARLLTYRAAAAQDAGGARVTLEASMAKAFATEAAQRIVDGAVQLLGGRGVLDAHPVALLYRAIRALRIYEGTTEIQQLVIARQLLARRRPA
jgi:acyl-CoA dehydrogenase